MFRLRRLIGGSVVVFILAGAALAQENSAPAASRDSVAAPLVTATATAKRVRFVSPGTVVQLRLEVYNEPGQKVFDTELRGGNVLDWHLQDGAGERLPVGTYATVLTIKGLSGRLSQRVGSVTVDDQRAAIGATGAAAFSLAQQQTIGPVEGNAAFAVLQEIEAEAMTAVTHDGLDGQVTSTRGALTFRTGDLFTGKDKEQMRLTEAGNLGIGTDKPEAKLDVAGTIRTSEGIEFANRTTGADGTKVTRLTTTATGGLQQTLANGTVVANATGTGTQSNIAKWTDNAGTLGDSSIFENASRNVGVGTTTPGAKLHVVGTQGVSGAGTFQMDGAVLFNNWTSTYPAFEVVNKNLTDNNVALFQFADAPSGAAHAGIGAVNTSHTNKYGDLFFFTKQSDGYQMRMGIYNGNVGIGTTAPAQKLDVVGDINTSTQYDIGGIRALAINGSQLGGFYSANTNIFAGADAGAATSSSSIYNSFFGKAAGFNNTFGSANSFFGALSGESNISGESNSFLGTGSGRKNQSGSLNSFFGDGTGGKNTTGDSNSFFGYSSGSSHTTGASNTFVGSLSGQSNTTENNNTFIGARANGIADITNATAIGVWAQVTRSNSLVLGAINGTNGANIDTNVGIGITAPTYKLHIIDPSNVGIRVETSLSGGRVASFASNGDFQIDAPNIPGGRFAVMEGGNVGINTPTPNAKLQVVGGDVAITTQFKGLILRANNGANCFRLLVTNTGTLATESVACP